MSNAQDRMPTGVEGLDFVMNGGIPLFSACVIAGQPGAGKTILCQQMLFANATPENRSLYMTTISEPAAKVVRYQQRFSFFDPSKIGDTFIYMDLGEIIRQQGPAKSLDALTQVMKDYEPKQIAVDSFRALHDMIADPQDFRLFVFELAVKLSSWSATAMLIGEYTKEETNTMAEFAVADSIISLTKEPTAGATRSYLEILKLRGSDYISGKHLLTIDNDGVHIYPRKMVSSKEGIPLGEQRVTSGITQFDRLLGGGYPERSVIALHGGAGTGKTLFGLQYVCNGALEKGEPGVYISYEESSAQLQSFARAFGWDVEDLIKRGLLQISFMEPLDISPEQELDRIRSLIQKVKAKRVVIDSLSPLLAGIEDVERLREVVYQLSLLVKSENATSLVISDEPVRNGSTVPETPQESVFDGVILLKNVLHDSKRERYMGVYKMRGLRHATGDQRFKITDNGIVVYPQPGEDELIGP